MNSGAPAMLRWVLAQRNLMSPLFLHWYFRR
jgi:hypothetical protein